MSLQMSIVKVLSSHPEGRATLAALNADLKILAGSGREWTMRMNRLAARAPDLDIFGQKLVVRDPGGWQLTAAGFEFLSKVEADAPISPEAVVAAALKPGPRVADAAPSMLAADRPRTSFVLIGRKTRRRRRPRGVMLKQAG